MKKIILILLTTIFIITLFVCNSFNNVVAGEIPIPAFKIELNDLPELKVDNEIKKDAFQMKINSDKLEYSKEWVMYDTYDFETGQYIDLQGKDQFFLHDLKLDLRASNLKESDNVNKLNIYSFLEAQTIDDDYLNAEFSMHNEHDKAYLNLNDVAVDFINNLGLKVTNKISMDKEYFDISLKNEVPVNIKQSITNAIFNNFIDLYFYRCNILLITNLNQDNLFIKINNFLNELYNNEVLEYFGYNLTEEEFKAFSLDTITKLEFDLKDFKHIKSTIIVGLSGIKKILLDLDLSYNKEDKYINDNDEEIYLYSEKTNIKIDLEIDLKLKNKITIPSVLK